MNKNVDIFLEEKNSRMEVAIDGMGRREMVEDDMIVMVARQMGTTDKVKNAEEKRKVWHNIIISQKTGQGRVDGQ